MIGDNSPQEVEEVKIRPKCGLLMMKDLPCFLDSKTGVYNVIDRRVDQMEVMV